MRTVWQSMTRLLRSLKTVAFVATLTLTTIFPMLANPSIAHATTCGVTCTYTDPWGTQEVAGSGWLNGGGVPIYSNGPSAPNGPSPDTYNCFTITGGAGGDGCGSGTVPSGIEWQCVELVNRLYLTKGWITNTWTGNGDALYGDAPSTLTKEAQGSITYVNPGDVIGMSKSNTPGHVAVISSVSGSNITIASQNTNVVYDTSFKLSGGNITFSGWSGYTIQGVIHHPNSSGSSSSSYDLHQFYVSNGSWVSFDVSNATGTQINGNPFEDSGSGIWAKDSNGHLRQFYVGSNGWTAFDVSNATGVNIGGDPYVDSSGTAWASGTNNHLYQFYVYGGTWNAFDVSNATGVSIAGIPIVDSGGGVWARDTNGHLRQFYVSGGSWTAFDVSNATGVNIASNIALANGAEFARDTNNHLRQFYVSGSWTAFDVSNATGVNVGANPVIDSGGGIWIDDTASHLRQFYVNGSWTAFDVSNVTGVTITGDPGISSAGNFAADSNGSLRQFYVSNGSWVAANIGGATGVTITSNPASGTSGEFAEAK